MEVNLREGILQAMETMEAFVFSLTEDDLPGVSHDQLLTQLDLVQCLEKMYEDVQQQIIASQPTPTLQASEIAARQSTRCRFFALKDCIEEAIDHLPAEVAPNLKSLQIRAVSSALMTALQIENQRILQHKQQELQATLLAHSKTASSQNCNAHVAHCQSNAAPDAHSCELPHEKPPTIMPSASFATPRQCQAPSESPTASYVIQVAAATPTASQVMLDNYDSEVRLPEGRKNDHHKIELNTLPNCRCDKDLHPSTLCSKVNALPNPNATHPESHLPANCEPNPLLADCHVSTATSTCRCCPKLSHHLANSTDPPPLKPNVSPPTTVRNPILCRILPPESSNATTPPEYNRIRDRHKTTLQGNPVDDASANLPAPFSSSAIPAAIAQSPLVSGDPATSLCSPDSLPVAAADSSRSFLPNLMPPLAIEPAETITVDIQTLPCHDLSGRTSLDPELSIPISHSDSSILSTGRSSTPASSSLSRQTSRSLGQFRTSNRRLLPKTFGAILPWPPDTVAIQPSSCVRPPDVLHPLPAQRLSLSSATPIPLQFSDAAFQKAIRCKPFSLGLPSSREIDLGLVVVDEPPLLTLDSNNIRGSAVTFLPTQLQTVHQSPDHFMKSYPPPEAMMNCDDNLAPQSPTADQSCSGDSPPSSGDIQPEETSQKSLNQRALDNSPFSLDASAEDLKCRSSMGISFPTLLMMTMAYPSDTLTSSMNPMNTLIPRFSPVASLVHGLQVVWEDPRPPEENEGWISATTFPMTSAMHRWIHLHPLPHIPWKDLNFGSTLPSLDQDCGLLKNPPQLKIPSSIPNSSFNRVPSSPVTNCFHLSSIPLFLHH
ncbi:uncharacterized protein LOC129792710 [Lutzomyia longipalpis]|uniref:uncharacterized protein LOC129792710 n=1 Tax=Lutzomyia longipalpis TaxID=7200 RepID=UPI002483AAE6|nr:uncharacterized protein LOC129792710 [Lutzomyia longipalpis]